MHKYIEPRALLSSSLIPPIPIEQQSAPRNLIQQIAEDGHPNLLAACWSGDLSRSYLRTSPLAYKNLQNISEISCISANLP
jgi:hypothetical protein